MKLNDHDQNFGDLDQKIENFTDGQKKHLHTNVNRRLEAIELAEKQTFDLIQSLNSQIEVDRQEFERMVALEKVFKDNVAADVKRMNQASFQINRSLIGQFKPREFPHVRHQVSIILKTPIRLC